MPPVAWNPGSLRTPDTTKLTALDRRRQPQPASHHVGGMCIMQPAQLPEIEGSVRAIFDEPADRKYSIQNIL